MEQSLRVAVLEDHPAMIEGYKGYLRNDPTIQIVASTSYGEDLLPLVEAHQPLDLLLLDIKVDTSPTNSSPYPVHFLIPQLLQRFPNLRILVISMHKSQTLIRAVIEAGASGYVLKDDQDSFAKFPAVLHTVAGGGIYFTREAHQILTYQPAGLPQLSPRQIEVLALCAAYPNLSSTELAKKLNVQSSTVRNILSLTYERLGVKSRAAAILKAQQLGLLADEESVVLPTGPPQGLESA